MENVTCSSVKRHSRIWTSNLPSLAVPRQPFFRLLLGDPKQSPGGAADGQRAHRTLLLKAPIGLRAAAAVGHRPSRGNWFRPDKVKATSSFACQLQSTYKDLSSVDLDLPEGLLV